MGKGGKWEGKRREEKGRVEMGRKIKKAERKG